MPAPRKLHDQFFKMAKAEGYLARSAYKLLEIHERKTLIRRGDRVLDLGCAPGSWLQVAEKLVGNSGVVVGIDLQEVTHPFGPRVHTLQDDAFTIDPARLTELGGGLFDVLLSDMAPNTTGHGDDLLSARLCRRVLELTPSVLRPGGHLIMKILEGADYPDVLKEAQAMFNEARGFKPKASRDVSREMFINARGLR